MHLSSLFAVCGFKSRVNLWFNLHVGVDCGIRAEIVGGGKSSQCACGS